MSKTNQLFLLADHIKLSLLERQRAQSLVNTDASPAVIDPRDEYIAQSLKQFSEALTALETAHPGGQENEDESASLAIKDALPSLKRQLEDLTSQFHGFSSPSSVYTLVHANDPTLAPDFTHATSTVPSRQQQQQQQQQPPKTSLRTGPHHALTSNSVSPSAAHPVKTVRFRDSPADADTADDANAQQLFGRNGRYRDDPEGYGEQAQQMSNVQIHQYHERILEEQDTQLDALGVSIGRQRELSMRIGDELDEHVAMLEEADGAVDRQQGRLARAGRQLKRVATGDSGDVRGMAIIVVLIIVLILLIAVLK